MRQKPPPLELPPFQYFRALFALNPGQKTKSSFPFQRTGLIGITPGLPSSLTDEAKSKWSKGHGLQ